MNRKQPRQQTPRYQSESWRADNAVRSLDDSFSSEEQNFAGYTFNRKPAKSQPTVRDQTRVLELLGKINYKIIKGSQVYVQAGGVVYKTMYGGYWRSVFTGAEHYLFHCEQVSGAVWASDDDTEVDLPISFSSDGWTANGHSLQFMLATDQKERKRRRATIVQGLSRRWRTMQLFGVR
ncbi:MAG TPA: hypothetical protein VLL54_02840 [Pyrinomonadaceae bacterium]|nr:hypothetical protein [Pyrinomonadaceae bacterium]